MKPAKKPEIRIVLDTNALFSGSCSDLVNERTRDFINDNSSFSDLATSWYMPDVVLSEREYQMRTRGMDLLPSVHKLEKLLGHNLAITDEILGHRVQEAIKKQMVELKLVRLDLKIDATHWSDIITRSVNRLPPFEAGDKEKGFRDALIGQCFLQLVDCSPTTPKVCRVVIVSGDALLREYLKEKTSDKLNVRLFETLDELKGLLNVLASEVELDFIDSVQEAVTKAFFVPKDTTTLYYTENIRNKIEEKFKAQLEEIPAGARSRENGTWYVSPCQFVSKTGQRTKWKTRIKVDSKALTVGLPEEPQGALSGSGLPRESDKTANILGVLLTQYAIKREVAKGGAVFAVSWSITVAANKAIRNASIDDIAFVENAWEKTSN